MIRPQDMRRDAGQPADRPNAGQRKAASTAPLMGRAPGKIQGTRDLNRPASSLDSGFQRSKQVKSTEGLVHSDSVAKLHLIGHGNLHCVFSGLGAPSAVMENVIFSREDHLKAAGHRLRRVIDMLSLSYVEAAEIMGISKHVLRNCMAGDNYVQPYALYRLCRAKGIDFNYVFLGDWGALPTRLGKQLEDELAAGMASATARGPMGAESS